MPLKFSDIIDIDAIQSLMESLYRASGIPVGIVAPDGEILVATGWQPICKNFHRKHPQTEARCRESDCYLRESLLSNQPLPECGYVEYKCRNGMNDIAMPIMIEGEYLATLFLGQFFYESPDESFFINQAMRYGFDEREYLDALRQVPVFSREKVEAILEYQSHFVSLLGGMGLEKLQRLRSEEDLRKSRLRYQSLLDTLPHGVQECDAKGTVTYGNAAFHQMNGYEPGTLIGTSVWSRLASEDAKKDLQAYLQFLVGEQPPPTPYISQNSTKDGRVIDIRVDWNYQRDVEGRVAGFLSVITDITEQKRILEDLREKERQISSLMSNLPGMVYRCKNDRNWTMEFVSHGCLEVTGYHPDDFVDNRKLSFDSLILPEDRERVWEEIQQPLGEKKPFALEYRIQNAEGSVRWVWEQGHGVFDDGGTLVALEGYISDITEQKIARQEIDSLARFPQENKNPVLRIREDGLLLYANMATTPIIPLFGRGIGSPTEEFWQKIVRSILETKKAVTLEKEWKGRTYSFSCAPIVSGEYVNIYGRDITRRKEAEEALKKAMKETETSRDRIDAILKSVADGLIVTDLNNRVVLLNRTAEILLKTSLGLAINNPLESLHVPECLSKELKEILTHKKETTTCEWEAHLDGSRRIILQARSTSVQSRDGILAGTITLLLDVTRERDLDRVKDEFISTAAHELQTPLTSILGYADILLQPEVVGEVGIEDQRAFLAIIRDKGLALKQIIRDLLDLSQIRLDRQIPLQRMPGDIAEALRNCLADYERFSKEHRFDIRISERPSLAIFDPLKIEQVFVNLLSNAVKFSPKGGMITVLGEEREGIYRVTIRDEGIGMTPEEKKRAFDKFYRADSSNTAQEGLGLGMSIVRSIVEGHGGTIRVESAPGKGTTVTVDLPLERHEGSA